MDIRDRRALKQEAAQALQQASYDPKKLVLLHTAIYLGAAAVVTILSYILSAQIENTGGLSGLGMRSILTTIQAALQLGFNFAMPFWMMGLTYAVLRIARRQPADPQDLNMGFLRFGPVVRLQLAQMLLYFLVGILCVNIGSTLFLLTPFADPLNEVLTQLSEQMAANSSLVIDEATENALMEAMIPMLVITAVLYAAVLIPLMYRFRMADFALMDEDKPGAIQALGISSRLMRDNRFQLFRLDLSFWWFYLLNLLIGLLSYASTLLPMLGITLPITPDVVYFVSYGLSLVAQLALYWWAGARVETTYGVLYDGLRTQRHPLRPPQPQTPPQNNPWQQM